MNYSPRKVSPLSAVIDCTYSNTVCALQIAELEVETFKLLCGLGDFPVAIGCREAVKCPVKPPTRLCSRRDTVPETRETKDTSSFWDLLFFKA